MIKKVANIAICCGLGCVLAWVLSTLSVIAIIFIRMAG